MSKPEPDYYLKFVERFITPGNLWRLDRLVDYDNKADRDLIEIAKTIPKWEVTLVSPLGISSEEVHDIKSSNTDVELKR